MAIDHEKLLAAIEAGKAASYGSVEQTDLSARRARAIESYLGLNTNPAPEGRSQVVDRTCYQVMSTIMPSLARIFTSSSDDICKAVAIGPEDEDAAEQTTAVLTHVVTRQNQWDQVFRDWAFDAGVSMNGYCMAYWDETKRQTREVYEGQSDDQVTALLSDKSVEVIQHSQALDEQATSEAQQAYQQAMQQWQQIAQQAHVAGQMPPPQPQPPEPVYLHDLVIERVETEGKVCIKVLPPEHCYVHTETPDWTLRECPYFEFRREMSISDVRAMGFDISDEIADDDDAETSLEDVARNRFYETDNDDMPGSARTVWVRMIWVKCAAEDDVARLYYVLMIGTEVLHAEPVSRIPVASMTAQPLPHRHIGMSIVETVTDIQDVRTAVTRGGLDNLYLANNGRHVISSHVNLQDFLDARPGGVVRMLDDSLPAEGHVVPLTHPFAFDSIIGSLEYFDQMAQNRTGASRYFSGTDANAINKTMGGTIALQNAASMRVEDIARQFAPAVEHLFEVVHELICKHNNKALSIKLRGKWVTVDPQVWRTKRDVRISVGVGAGNKDSMIQQLTMIFGAQMQLAPMGLAGPVQVHATVTEMAKLAGFSNPDKFWIDPGKTPPPPPPPSPDQIKAQTEMQKLQFQSQQDQLKFQAETEIEQRRLMLQAEVDKQREEMQARQKALEAQQSAELEQQKAMLQAQADAQRIEFERWKAELDASVKLAIAEKSAQSAEMGQAAQADSGAKIDTVLQAMQAIQEAINSPTEIVRDAGGRAVGIKRGNRTQQIVRGPDGRAIGVQ